MFEQQTKELDSTHDQQVAAKPEEQKAEQQLTETQAPVQEETLNEQPVK